MMKNNDLADALISTNVKLIGWLTGVIERGTDPRPVAPNPPPPPPPIKPEDLVNLRHILHHFQEELKSRH
jgi:hypothetical protein